MRWSLLFKKPNDQRRINLFQCYTNGMEKLWKFEIKKKTAQCLFGRPISVNEKDFCSTPFGKTQTDAVSFCWLKMQPLRHWFLGRFDTATIIPGYRDASYYSCHSFREKIEVVELSHRSVCVVRKFKIAGD